MRHTLDIFIRRQVAGNCAHGKEPMGSTKCGEFSRLAKELLPSQGGLRSKEEATDFRDTNRNPCTCRCSGGS